MRLFFKFLLVALLWTQGALFGKEQRVQQKDIRAMLEEIFSYHVENRGFSPLVARRSIKIFIDYFDPQKAYFLQSEVEPYLNLSKDRLALCVQEYEKGQFGLYGEVSALMQKAAARARKIRKELIDEFIATGELGPLKYKSSFIHAYPHSEESLKDKIRSQIDSWIKKRSQKGKSLWESKEYREKNMRYWEKKKRQHEKPFFFDAKDEPRPSAEEREHLLCVHLMKSIARSLDAHSAYYSQSEADEFRAHLKKELTGVGVVLKEEIDGIKIVDVIMGSPAAQDKQVQVGDYLIEVDGISLKDKTFEEALDLMKGVPQSEVTLGLLRQIDDNAYVNVYVKVKREKIIMEDQRLTFDYEPFADGIIGKITLPSFYDNENGMSAEKDFRLALKELKSQGTLYGLVIDLRENSGGFLTQAVKIAGLFVPKGIIVISKYRDGEVRYNRDLDGRLFYNGPIVLLTSKASASAAEIVAGAMQDYGVALVVGDERTYGKGSMQYQTITSEKAKSFYKVTVGRYYTLSGRSTQIEGVKADIHVPTEYSPYSIGERFLEFPLSSDRLDYQEILKIPGIDPSALAFFQKPENSLPVHSPWKNMLASLQENSRKRLENNQNYRSFLGISDPQKKRWGDEPQLTTAQNANWGAQDLQLAEAVNILKDMALLSHPTK